MVLQMELMRQAEEAEQGNGPGAGSGGPGGAALNSQRLPRGGGNGDTVQYVNEHKHD
jgi:hypothetical protein